jgi:hypothetical protein
MASARSLCNPSNQMPTFRVYFKILLPFRLLPVFSSKVPGVSVFQLKSVTVSYCFVFFLDACLVVAFHVLKDRGGTMASVSMSLFHHAPSANLMESPAHQMIAESPKDFFTRPALPEGSSVGKLPLSENPQCLADN